MISYIGLAGQLLLDT